MGRRSDRAGLPVDLNDHLHLFSLDLNDLLFPRASLTQMRLRSRKQRHHLQIILPSPAPTHLLPFLPYPLVSGIDHPFLPPPFHLPERIFVRLLYFGHVQRRPRCKAVDRPGVQVVLERSRWVTVGGRVVGDELGAQGWGEVLVLWKGRAAEVG